MKAAMFVPSGTFGLADADSVLSELKDIDVGGLASVEVIPGKGGQPPRLFMSTRQTLNMLVRAARSTVSDDERDAAVARTAERLATSGPFKTAMFVSGDLSRSPREVLETAGIDNARSTRLIVLDSRQFSLLNGVDKDTRTAVRAAMGIGPEKLPVQWASSAAYAIVNTQRRSLARGAGVTFLAWDRVTDMTDVKADPDLVEKARAEKAEARRNLETAVKRAYQHVMYLDLGDDANSEPRIDKTITFEHENQTALDGTTVWKALVEAEKAFEIGTFSGKALVHNLRDADYDKPLDEVRDLFWYSPRMPLLPGGDADLQRAIHEAVTAGTIRLTGADGTERIVTSASEIGVGLSSLHLAKPLPIGQIEPGAEPEPGPVVARPGPIGPGADPFSPVSGPGLADHEKELAFSLRTSLSSDTARDGLYALLQELADKVDEGSASYSEIMVKIRVVAEAADTLAELARKAATNVNIRDV